MKSDQVPQDNSRTYGGHRKLLYAQQDNGRYASVQSSGWEPETTATLSAVATFEQQTEEALARWREGEGTALAYWMYKQRMDITTLAQASGVFAWRVRRHLRPKVFRRLPSRLLRRYAEALGIDVQQLQAAAPPKL